MKNTISKYLSFILRHSPETINLTLDKNGYILVSDLIENVNEYTHYQLDREILGRIVDGDSKGRFAYSEDNTKIRATQGHSIKIDLGYEDKEPPKYLYHGTTVRFVGSIFNVGIKRQERQYVHLTDNIKTAISVGKRHGKPAVFKVYSNKMYKEGYKFQLTDNNVWLIENVPPKFIELISV